MVHRRAADDRRPDRRGRRARAAAGPRLGGGTRASSAGRSPTSSWCQGMLADCAVDIAVNRAFTHQVAWEADHRAPTARPCTPRRRWPSCPRREAAGRVVDRCLQIFGGRGYDRAYPVERLYREVRVDRIWEGTSEIQRLIIANELVKRGTGALQFRDAVRHRSPHDSEERHGLPLLPPPGGAQGDRAQPLLGASRSTSWTARRTTGCRPRRTGRSATRCWRTGCRRSTCRPSGAAPGSPSLSR